MAQQDPGQLEAGGDDLQRKSGRDRSRSGDEQSRQLAQMGKPNGILRRRAGDLLGQK